MKEISLTQGFTAIVDEVDFEYLNQWKWHVQKSYNTFYAARAKTIDGKKRTILMHRVILQLSDYNQKADHKNHNGLDNRRDNLRGCTDQENMRNIKSILEGKSSKYKGVSYKKNRGKWEVRIAVNKKNTFLGSFSNEQDAAHAYNAAAVKMFGEFAFCNSV